MECVFIIYCSTNKDKGKQKRKLQSMNGEEEQIIEFKNVNGVLNERNEIISNCRQTDASF